MSLRVEQSETNAFERDVNDIGSKHHCASGVGHGFLWIRIKDDHIAVAERRGVSVLSVVFRKAQCDIFHRPITVCFTAMCIKY